MLRSVACAMAVFGTTGFAAADYYTDDAADIFDGGLTNLDIIGAEITNDDFDLVVSIDFLDLNADWGKYVMLIDRVGFENQSLENPWGRQITTPSGIDAFMGSWIDGGGGGGAYRMDSSGDWIGTGGVSPEVDWEGDRITYRMALADLGLELGDTFNFDIGTTGGGESDPAIDLLSTNDVQPGWGRGSSSPMSNSYTVIPTPGVISLALVCGFGARRRRD